jgi:hypothetical protein
MRTTLLSGLVLIVISACSEASAPASPAEEAAAVDASASPTSAPQAEAADPALDKAIAETLGDDAESTRLVVRTVGEGDRRLALAYLMGLNWCGSGGCNLLILRPTAQGWESVGNVSRVSLPVRVLTTTSNGLPDLGVTVSGGGGPPAYEARLTFDGRTYPRFPPDEAVTDAAGTVVIDDADIAPPAE